MHPTFLLSEGQAGNLSALSEICTGPKILLCVGPIGSFALFDEECQGVVEGMATFGGCKVVMG